MQQLHYRSAATGTTQLTAAQLLLDEYPTRMTPLRMYCERAAGTQSAACAEAAISSFVPRQCRVMHHPTRYQQLT